MVSSHGLSASELMSATSLHNRERLMTAELLKQQHQHHLGHRENVATAMALASRNHTFPVSSRTEEPQQSPGSREDLILKRAISQLSAVSRHHSLQHQDRSHPLLPRPEDRHHPVSGSIAAAAALSMEGSRRSSLCCAENDLLPEKDICFGRGQRVQRRKANVAFRKIVATYQETYDQAVSREDKKAVVKKVSRIFSRTGYRFFKESEETTLYGHSKMWVAVSDHDVEYKIGHSFRSGRKQIKQQKKNNQQRNQQKSVNGGDVGASDDAPKGGNKDHPKRLSRYIVTKVNNNSDDDCVLKEDELSDKCICIGDKREKYTGKEAYQYFREFILTFKSIFGTSESADEKTKIVSSLIEQFKSNKGYRFLKLISMKKDVEFWVEASADDIQCEVLFILGRSSPQQPPTEKKVENKHGTNDATGHSIEDNLPKKRQRLLPDSTSLEASCPRPSAVKRTVTDQEAGANSNNNEPKTATISMGSSLPSSSGSKNLPVASSTSSVSSSTKPGDKVPWKKGRKRSLHKAAKTTVTTLQKPTTFTWVPSEIICKRPGESECKISKTPKLNGTDPKAETEIMSAIHRSGVSVPPSLSLPSVLFGKLPSYTGSSQALDPSSSSGSQSQFAAAADMAAASRAKLLSSGRSPQHHQLPGFGTPSALGGRINDTLGKALHAMRSSSNPPTPPSNFFAATATAASSLHHRSNNERSLIVEKAKQFEAAKHFAMRTKLLEHLKQQELLYIEKKHRLDMLDLQLQSPESRM